MSIYRYHSFVVPCIILTFFVCAPAQGQGALVWSDEFDGTSLDTSNWEYMIGAGGWGNNELQYYTSRQENVSVSGGYLHIVARQESYGGADYTSARIRSINKRDFLYGRMEARIKLPSTTGIWPAFWMMPTDSVYGGWAASGEIDIMESTNIATTVHGTIHYGGNWPNNVNSGGSHSDGTDYSQDFHVYTLEWEQDVMRWYVDGIHYNTETSSTWYSDNAPGNSRAPFDQYFHFLLNVAVGGNWPGYPDGSSVFPQEMSVDWVRVYNTSNTAPTVSIDAPTDGDVLPIGNVTIDATAEDSDGTIDHVEFYVNGGSIGQDSTAPYSITWTAAEGCHRIRVVAVDDQDWTASDEISVKVGEGCAGDPYLGVPAEIPGAIEFENYDLGGEGVAYHDCDSENNGGQYRPDEGVDLEAASGGGYNVGWMCAGEWLNYAVNVANPGYYKIEVRVASQETGGTFALELDGEDVTGNVDIPVTGGWQAWTTTSTTAILTGGLQELSFINISEDDSYNLDRMTFTRFEDHDYDLDGDVDLTDWVWFLRCLSGPDSSVPQGMCPAEYFERSDVDGDNDVDLNDFAVFQQARTSQ